MISQTFHWSLGSEALLKSAIDTKSFKREGWDWKRIGPSNFVLNLLMINITTITIYLFFIVLFRKENNMLLAMPDASKLRAHIIRRDFPGRNFPQLFSRFHYLRMKSTSPKEYIEDLKVRRWHSFLFAEPVQRICFSLKNKRMYSQKSWFPKENRKVASKIVSMMSSQGYKQHVVGSMSKTLPMLKNSLLNFSRERNLIIRGKLLHPNIRVRHIRCKRSVKRKEKELKAILCPMLPSNAKRPRSKHIFLFFQ